MKIITICGSLKFQDEMMIVAQKLSLKGNCVLTPVYPAIDNFKLSNKQLEYLRDEHLKRIEMSDVILVLNKDNYIGESTKLEISYAESLNKRVLYYTDNNYL